MWAFTLRRVLYAVPVLLGVSMLVFALIHLAPGDVVDLLVPPEVPLDIAASLRQRFRLAEELFGALGNTFVLAVPAALLGFAAGTALGALAALNRTSWLDRLFSVLAITGVSLPHYWVGIVLVAIFSVVLNLLPAQGMGFEGLPSSWEDVKHLLLPV